MVITLGTGLAVVGAGLALGIAGLSTAAGSGAAGVAGAGVVAENKKNFRNALSFQAMPQTQTIYAFITALLILLGTGLVGAAGKEVSTAQGLTMLGAGLVVALTGVSAVYQGLVSASSIVSSVKNKDAFAPGLVFSGQCETPAIFGFIIAVMILIVGLAVLG